MAVASLGIHRRDHPVNCGAPGNAERAVVACLADDRCRQGGGLVDLIGEGASLQLFQRLKAVSHQVINELLTSLGVVPVAGGLAGPGVVVVAANVFADLGFEGVVCDPAASPGWRCG